ncbi:TrkA family potassium uptake protein [Desulfuromonas sp. AOP6]|uniref:potassium channel family protein n=1 Tax=Desulfuromonas sp. AOP6 TaxID=1566351 RepID=UPI001270B02F|nr:TrkA family potassium uptake protein [Desulfuromonas sp. AOP6]BCA81183.1 potassium transporter Trk [Desulfuromonas sp. AOP6]
MKSYVVIGLGNFGRNVALELASYGEEVLAVDRDERRVEELRDQVTASVIADARDKEALADFVSADMEAAILNLGDNLEAMALTTLNLVDLGVKRIIVKAETPTIGKIVKAIGATEWINPEQEGARHLARTLHQPNLIEHIPLAPDYDIVEVAIPDRFVGRSLGDIDLRRHHDVVVIAVKEILTDRIHLIPSANFVFEVDSAMILMGKKENLEKLQ